MMPKKGDHPSTKMKKFKEARSGFSLSHCISEPFV